MIYAQFPQNSLALGLVLFNSFQCCLPLFFKSFLKQQLNSWDYELDSQLINKGSSNHPQFVITSTQKCLLQSSSISSTWPEINYNSILPINTSINLNLILLLIISLPNPISICTLQNPISTPWNPNTSPSLSRISKACSPESSATAN